MKTIADLFDGRLKDSGDVAVAFWSAPGAPNVNAPTSGDPLPVVGNHGRWVVCCPCGSAQLACLGDPRYLCADCGNDYQGGDFRPVQWPADVDQIAALLDVRPEALANWTDESVADLAAENQQLGLGG